MTGNQTPHSAANPDRNSLDRQSVQGSCVAINGRGLLIIGPPGAGKSDLALRLLDRGALLVADDLVHICVHGGRLMAEPAVQQPPQIEVRGIGLVQWPACVAAMVPLVMALNVGGTAERIGTASQFGPLNGLFLPCLTITPHEVSAAIKAEVALMQWGL